ncbi:hypothetical protein [Thermogemmatispora sp.]|uniref:hypothetical protein n=1 Tax=Thermogemmatispora sp. TaxID=1968838 RepID=UPI002610ED07|nr:hypothetical protein [Thermogemmatispora sp.]
MPAPGNVPPPWLDQLDREVANRRWRAPRRDSLERFPDLPRETASAFQADASDSNEAQPSLSLPQADSRSEEQESSALESQSETAAVAEAWRRAWLADAPTSAVPATRSESAQGEEAGSMASSEGGTRSARVLSPRELHVRVWEENETLIMPQPEVTSEAETQQLPGAAALPEGRPRAEQILASSPYKSESGQGLVLEREAEPRPAAQMATENPGTGQQYDQHQQAVDDLPTMPLKASPGPGLVIERASTPRPPQWQRRGLGKEAGMTEAEQKNALAGSSGIEELDTMRLAAQTPAAASSASAVDAGLRRAQPVTPLPASPITPSGWSSSSLSGIRETPLFTGSATGVGAGAPSFKTLEAPGWSAGEAERTPQRAVSSLRQWEAEETAALPQVEKLAASATPRSTPLEDASGTPRRRRRPLAVVALVLALLLISGGLTAWVVVYQPFAVPLITQPLRPFSDQRLGIALSYPQGWSYQVDYQKGKVAFSDSTHTGQLVIVVAPAEEQDLSHYLQKEAGQVGLTNAKPGTPLTFGGASWQQLRGTVTIAGASYTETLLATTHAGHLYTFMQLAYQKIYTDEEKQVFGPVRASFRFLS